MFTGILLWMAMQAGTAASFPMHEFFVTGGCGTVNSDICVKWDERELIVAAPPEPTKFPPETQLCVAPNHCHTMAEWAALDEKQNMIRGEFETFDHVYTVDDLPEDVPADEYSTTIKGSTSVRYYCRDKSRILLRAEDGTAWCHKPNTRGK